MPRLLSRTATPLMTGLFLVSLVSGLALFLGIGHGLFREMHEILGVALILPVGLHVWRNWRPMTAYFRHAPMAVALGLSALLALAFALPAATGAAGTGSPLPLAFAHAVLTHSPAEVAPLLDTTPEALVQRLLAAGFAAPGPDDALTDIAAASGKT